MIRAIVRLYCAIDDHLENTFVLLTTVTNDNRDEEIGKFDSAYDDEGFLAALQDLDGSAATNVISDAVGAPYHSTHPF